MHWIILALALEVLMIYSWAAQSAMQKPDKKKQPKKPVKKLVKIGGVLYEIEEGESKKESNGK